MKSITIITAKEKSNDCEEGCSSAAADSYITFQNNKTYCEEGAEMEIKKSIKIPVVS